MAIDPTSDEWEVAFVDKVINYQVEDQVGAVVTDAQPTEHTHAMACLLIEARHIKLGDTMRFMMRFDGLRFEQLALIVDEMKERMHT